MNQRNYPRWRRPLVSLVAIPLALIAAGTGLYYANLHRLSAVDRIINLEPMDLAGQSRVIVFAPHCDDETLGLGGVIKSLTDTGADVRTVFFTNGDGFRIAAQFHLQKLNLTDSDYIRFGEARQTEALAATSQLGQHQPQIEFLGFPDQGLLSMLVATGPSPKPFRPDTTKSESVPYKNASASGQLHTRESVISQLQSTLEHEKPTDIYVTHPLDDHSDHAAAPVYVQLAVDRSVMSGKLPRPRIHWYLIHRGDWPLPQGEHPDRWLVPPAAIAESGKQWTSIALTTSTLAAKRDALAHYKSQMNVMQRMLLSFLRKNEIVTSGDKWNRDRAAATEPIGDNVARFANPSADIARLDTAITGDSLTVTTTMAGPCSPAIDAFVTVVTSSIAESNAFRFKLPRPQLLETQSEITTSIPLKSLGVNASTLTVAVGVSTFAAEGLLVDRSAFHFVDLTSMSAEAKSSYHRQSGVR